MIDLKRLRERRLVQIVIAYLASGWVAITIVGELTDRGVVPELWYRIALVVFLFGIPAALVAGWYHGEKGHQGVTRTEVGLLGVIAIGAGFAVSAVVRAAFVPQTAADLDVELEASRIAVLYFDDNSDGGELGYVADGLTEDLIDQLSAVERLDVVTRNGAALFRGTDAGIDSIARTLDVGTLIEGSVSGNDDRIRVTVRLTDASSGSEIESAGFEFPAAEILTLQDSIAVEISRSLRTWLGDNIQVRRSRGSTRNVAAWALAQRAARAAAEAKAVASHEGLEPAADLYATADSLLVEASGIDPSWVEPHVLRARYAYDRSRLADDIDTLADNADAAIAHAEAALALDSNNAEALDVRGTTKYWQFLIGTTADPDERRRMLADARADLERAIQLGNLATAYSTISHLYYRDDVGSALLAARRAYETDAFLDVANEVLWRLYTGSYDLEQFPQAKRWCEEGHRRFGEDFRFAECRLWMASTPVGDLPPAEAWAVRERLLATTPEGRREYEAVLSRMLVAGALQKAGLTDSATAVLDDAGSVGFEADPTQDLLSVEAFMRSLTGDQDAALGLLRRYMTANPEHAFQRGDDLSWWWDALQSHPDFESLYANR